VLGEPENQFFLTRASAQRMRARKKQFLAINNKSELSAQTELTE
jgi:hypothetical protein